MTNMSIQPLWLTHFIEILLVLEFQLTKFIAGAFSYRAHFRPQISSNMICDKLVYFDLYFFSYEVETYSPENLFSHLQAGKQILYLVSYISDIYA